MNYYYKLKSLKDMEVFIPYLKLAKYENFCYEPGDGLLISKGELIWTSHSFFRVKHLEDVTDLSKKDFLTQVILLIL